MLKVKKHIFLIIIGIALLNPFAFAQDAGLASPNSCSATITWVTDEPSTSQVEYGTDITNGHENASHLNPDLVIHHKIVLSDLTPSTLYHYRVKSKDAAGNETASEDFTFVTLSSPDSSPPQISDIEALGIVAGGPASEPIQTEEIEPQEEEVKQEEVKIEPSLISSEQLSTEQAGQLTKKEAPIEKMLIETGGLLLSRGKWQIEPSFTYAHTSANRITVTGFSILPVLVIGEINTERMKRDIFIETLTTRYGLLNNLQCELKVPYRYQFERTSTEAGPEETRDLGGIGDIEGGLYCQFMREKGWIPDLIAGVSGKSRTGEAPYGQDIGLGTGHWAVKFSTVAVKSSDPAILFGGLSYTWNMERDNITDYGKVDPGDTIGYSLGLAFALNYQVALNFQFAQDITTTMKMNDDDVPASFTNVALLKCGVTYSINKNLSLDVMTSYGLTTDASDLILEVRLPYTF